jgi:hypothetical protein
MTSAWRGQAGRQAPHPVQRAASIATDLRPRPPGCSLTRLSARTGQAATQAPQPVQQGRQRTGEGLTG